MHSGEGARPAPAIAYARWLDALVRAGWSARLAAGEAGDPGIVPGPETVPLADALGRVTASPVTAACPSPRDDCAAMDGIAVRAADVTAAPAPDGTLRLPPGTFRWIDTGDPMPPEADAVVIRERLMRQDDGSVLVSAAPAGGHGHGASHGGSAPGHHVRAAGEDFAAGDVLLPAGRRLRPGDLAAAAAGGHVTMPVVRRPAVTIIPTGDEIRPLGTALRRGDILDTNSLMLAARCRELGAAAAVTPVVRDDPDALAAELRRAAARSDMVLVIAGSSRGRDDHTGSVLAQVGGVAVSGVAVRPGHPALLGHAKRPADAPGPPGGVAPVIGLPGYPLAAAVVFELFAVPVLAALAGGTASRPSLRAQLSRRWASPGGVEEWVLVTLEAAGPGGLPMATPARRGASSTSQLAQADAWWPVPAGRSSFEPGAEIDVFPITPAW